LLLNVVRSFGEGRRVNLAQKELEDLEIEDLEVLFTRLKGSPRLHPALREHSVGGIVDESRRVRNALSTRTTRRWPARFACSVEVPARSRPKVRLTVALRSFKGPRGAACSMCIEVLR